VINNLLRTDISSKEKARL